MKAARSLSAIKGENFNVRLRFGCYCIFEKGNKQVPCSRKRSRKHRRKIHEKSKSLWFQKTTLWDDLRDCTDGNVYAGDHGTGL